MGVPVSMEVRERARKIRLLMLDVDGVMTDGRIIFDDQGRETKVFDVRDGHGIKMLQRAGIEVAIVTGRESAVVDRRAAELGIRWVRQKAFDKGVVYREIAHGLEIEDEEVCFVGDDVVDIPVLRRVGLPIAVADAHEDSKRCAAYVTLCPGGRGAVREVCELILQAQEKWDEVMGRYR